MKNEKGFTLIELLVVVAIIGILAAIAIPQFAAYKVRAFNSRSESDVRNLVTAEEAYYVDNEVYAACADDACPGTLPGFNESNNVEISAALLGAGDGFTSTSTHPQGDLIFSYDSTTGTISSAAAP